MQTPFNLSKLYTSEFARAVIQKLDCTFDLDTGSILQSDKVIGFAGGAVASAVFELLELNLPTAYHDLDVWKFDNNWTDEIITRKDFGFLCTEDYDDFSLACNGYTIHSATREERINDIVVSCDSLEVLLQGFDINSIRVGINGDGLVCTDDFIEFLITKTMKVVEYCTPTNSFIRILKKHKLDGFKIDPVNIEHLAKVISSEHYMIDNSKDLTANYGTLFGERKAQLLQRLISEHELIDLGLKLTSSTLNKQTPPYNQPETVPVCVYQLKPTSKQLSQLDFLEPLRENITEGYCLGNLIVPRLRLAVKEVLAKQPQNINLIKEHFGSSSQLEANWMLLLKSYDFSDTSLSEWKELEACRTVLRGADSTKIKNSTDLRNFNRNCRYVIENGDITDIINPHFTSNRRLLDATAEMKDWELLNWPEFLKAINTFTRNSREIRSSNNVRAIFSHILKELDFNGATVTEVLNEQEIVDLQKQLNAPKISFSNYKKSPVVLLKIQVGDETSMVPLNPCWNRDYLATLSNDEILNIDFRQAIPTPAILGYELDAQTSHVQLSYTDEAKLIAEQVINRANDVAKQ